MKKSFTFLSIFVLVPVALYFSSCGNNATDATAENKQDSIKAVIARGEYLAVHVAACIHCHSKRDLSKYSGPVLPGTEGGGGQKFDNTILAALPGTFYAKNITPDVETGIGTWTDEEIIRAITQGIRKNGDTLFPLMPYASFNRMAKDDLLSIVAYLRTLTPIKNEVPERMMMIPISAAYPAAVLQPSIEQNKRPLKSDIVNYGSYLVNMADCGGCHTPFVKGQPDMTLHFAGGNTFNLPSFKVTSANITPDSATGIGAWSEAAFIEKFAACRNKDRYDYNPGKSNTIMPLVDFAGIKDDDLKAMYAYLRTVTPVKNKIEKYPK
ncbi:MAG TPA: c-type cytochrome [Phnomibacter sp.]|nr:c-type cytochrome [Phnomibacter sp.]